MRALFAGALAALLFCLVFQTFRAEAEPDIDELKVSAALTRPCKMAGKRPQIVSVSSTSARTTNAVAKGQVRIACDVDVQFYEGGFGITGPTAGTGDNPLFLYTPEYFLSSGGKFAFILKGATGATGSCYVSECQ
jgi:hypothetical protein